MTTQATIQNLRRKFESLLSAFGVSEGAQRSAARPIEAALAEPGKLLGLAAGSPARIGTLLVRAGLLRWNEVASVLDEQRRTGERFGQVLVRRGRLGALERDTVLAFQDAQRRGAGGSSALRLGEILVATGDITREQLREALRKQEASGGRLGAVLRSVAGLGRDRIESALRLQAKLVRTTLSLALVAGAGGMLAGCGAVGGPRADSEEAIVVPYYGAKHAGGPVVSGWKQFCSRQPWECTQQQGKAIVPMEVVMQVNREVNRRIRYIEDGAHFGVNDHWTTAQDGMGDCEDFALAKRQVLRGMGYSSESMKLVALMTKGGRAESHMVLAVRTERGDVLLDNNYEELQVPGDYRDMFIITGVESQGSWYALDRIEARQAVRTAGAANPAGV